MAKPSSLSDPPVSREQRARWAVDLRELASLVNPVPPARVSPMGSRLACPRPHVKTQVTWVDGYSAAVAQGQPDPSSVATLVFGSARHPGGGWERGATAQEEDLSLCSSWALAAQQAPSGFYDTPHRWEGPDAGLWATGHWFASSPGVWLDDPQPTAFVGISAPNLTWARAQRARVAMDLARRHLVNRLAWALSVTALEGRTTLVGGMVGTGVFGWERGEVLAAWNDALRVAEHLPAHLVMAVPGFDRWEAALQAQAHRVGEPDANER